MASAQTEYMRTWREQNRERMRDINRRYYHNKGAAWRKANIVRVNEQRRSRYSARPEVEVARSRATYRRIRARLFSGYGNACACCNETEPSFLELDHVKGGGAKHFHSFTSPINLYREVILAGFPPIYRLLCANCNRGRQRNGGVCPHREQVSEAI